MRTPPGNKQVVNTWFEEKLANSRFLTFSILLHIALVVMGGSVVLFKRYVAVDDFPKFEGGGVEEKQVEVNVEAVNVETEQVLPRMAEPSVSRLVVNVVGNSQYSVSIPTSTMALNTAEVVKPIVLVERSVGVSGRGLPKTYEGRMDGTSRLVAIKDKGGKVKSEMAVMGALRWFKQHQGEDGSWGTSNKAGMTGLVILCYLGHGETPEAPEFGTTVKRAMDWMLENGRANQGNLSMVKGPFGQATVYEHAIATYAIGEYYTMTKDERYIELLKQAVGYIVEGQAPDGGWQYGYGKGPDSDTSVSGWQIQALKAAHLSELKIAGVDEALDRAMVNLKRVQGPKGGFGYRKAEDRYSLTGVGVLCTYFWKSDLDRGVREGMEFLLKETSERHPVKYQGESADLYAWYYHTQACLMYGGTAWSKWNRWFQDEISGAQSADGSWPLTGNKKAHGPEVATGELGQVYRTALCTLMLEVYYRYLPVTRS